MAFLALAALLAAAPAPACEPQLVPLGPIGRAKVVAFTGPIDLNPVCAVVANLDAEAVRAHIVDAPAAAAVIASLDSDAAEHIALPGLADVGFAAFLIRPGGVVAPTGGDTSTEPRVVIAFAGPRLLVIGFSPISMIDLVRILRDKPGTFDADAIERAVLAATGPGARVSAGGLLSNGPLNAPPLATRYVTFTPLSR